MYAISLTEISPYSWGVVILLAVLNYLRIITYGGGHAHPCSQHEESSSSAIHSERYLFETLSAQLESPLYRHMSAEPDPDSTHSPSSSPAHAGGHHIGEECADFLMHYFAFCGGALLVLVLLIACLTWYSESRLLRLATTKLTMDKSTALDKYRKILTALAIVEQGRFARAPSRLMKSNMMIETPESLPQESKISLDDSHVYHMVTLRAVLETKKYRDERKVNQDDFRRNEAFSQISSFLCCDYSFATKAEKRKQIQVLREKKLEEYEMSFKHSTKLTKIFGDSGFLKGFDAKQPITEEGPRGGYIRKTQVESEKVDDTEYENHVLNVEENSIFVGNNRELYRLTIEVTLMLYALYLSLWISQSIVLAKYSSAPVLNDILGVIPIVLVFMLTYYIQYHSNMLLAVTSLRNENAEWMCEQDHIKGKTLPLLRKEIMEIHARFDRNFEEAMDELFMLVNSDDDDKITLDEFSNLLHTLDIHLAKSETRVLFRAMDTDGRYGLIDILLVDILP